MEKIIEIDINRVEDLCEVYNKDRVSRRLIDYVIEQAFFVKRNEKTKVVVYDKCEVGEKSLLIVKQGLELYYKKKQQKYLYTNIKQIVLLIIGIFLLFLSFSIDSENVFKEFLLILGWVPIWEVMYSELFSDIKERRIFKVLKKLLKGEFIYVYEENSDNN